MALTDIQTEKRRTLRETGLAVTTLFASTGTLVCCALPILLVSIAGLGSVVASLTNNFPLLVTLSQYKEWVFGLSGLMLAVAGWLVWRPGRTCPADPGLAEWCNRFHAWNRRIILMSGVLWMVGFLAAFLALPVRKWLGL